MKLSLFSGEPGLRLCAVIVLSAGALVLGSQPAFAAEQPIGTLGSIIGKAQIMRGGQTLPATKGMQVFASDSLVTAEKTAVKIQFTDGGTFMAFENSKVKIEEYKVQATGSETSLKSAFDIAKGKVRFFVKPNPNQKVDAKYKTSNAVMGIRGTSGFIDASTPGKTQLVVLTGKVEVSNPADPGKAVMVPPGQMTDVVGRSVPTAPKEAPPTLLSNLNSESKRVDPASSSDGSEGGGKPAAEEKKEQKQEEKKEEKREEKKEEKKSEGDSKKSDGDAKKSDGDSKKSDGDAKKSDGDSKKSDGDAKKSDGGGGQSSDGKKQNDSKSGDAKKSDGGDKQSADTKKSDDPGTAKSDDKKSSDSKSTDQKSDSKSAASDKKPEADKKSTGAAPAKDSKDSSSGAAGGKSDDQKPAVAADKPDAKPDAKPQGGSSPANRPASAGNAPSSGGSSAGGNSGPASANAGAAQPAPMKIERKTVYAPDGSSGIIVKDDKLSSLTATSTGLPKSRLDTNAVNSGPSAAAPVPGAASGSASAAPTDIVQSQVMKQVQEVQNTTTTTNKVIETQVQEVVKAAEEPTRKTIKVRVQLPSAPPQ